MADGSTPTNGQEMAVDIVARITSLVSGMKESATAVQESSAAMTESLETVAATAEAVMAPFIALTALMAGGKMFEDSVHGVVDLAVQLDVMRQKTGMSVEELSRLKYAADQSHVSSEQLTIGLQRLSRAMEQAAKGGATPAAEAFKILGIQATDSTGQLRPMESMLLDIAQRFENMPDGPTKAALAMDLFGRSGAALIPLLNRGKDGIAELEKEADNLGFTMGNKDVAAALQYEEATKRLHAVWTGFVRTLVVAVLPALEKIVQTFQALIYMVQATEWAIAAATDVMTLNFHNARLEADKMVEALKKARDSYTERAPAQATGEGGPTPIIQPTHKEKISEMEKFRYEWDQLRNATGSDMQDLTALETLFWITKLQSVKEGSKEYLEIYGRITQLQKEQDKSAYDAQLEAFHAQEALDKDNLAQVVEDKREELAFIRQHYAEMSKEVQAGIKAVNEAQAALLKQTTEQWKEVFKELPDAFNRTVTSMKQTGGTFEQFMRQLGRTIVEDWIAGEWKIVTAHAAAWLARKGITAEGVAETVILEAWSTLKVIAMKAAEAAAGAWAAISGIPYVGPFLAPAAAASALAGVLALAGGIHSAAGGFDVPSGLNPVTQLHAQEMVLPKEYADVIRGMASSGGGRGDVHLHVHTIDAGGVRQFLMKHKDHVAAAAHAAAIDGVGFRTQPGRRA